MSAGMSMAGISPEQGPPLLIPASFFVTAPLAVVAAGGLLIHGGSALLVTRFAGATAALVHLGTLGLMAMVMLGALYQVIPVVAGATVPFARGAHAVHAALVVSVVALGWGFVGAERLAVVAGGSLLALTFLAFLVPVGIALARTPVGGPTVWGMRVAVAGLAWVVGLGVWLAHVRGSGVPSPRYASGLSAHLTTGLVIWIGGLISGVSFQVVPMFYLTPAYPRWATRGLVAAFAFSFLAIVALFAVGAEPTRVALAAAPGALAAWVVHPVVTLLGASKRRRKRPDPSLWFWQAGLATALLALPVGGLALFADDARFPVLFGWLVLFGWAAMIVHGMLGRIVPFLVWFHRFSKRVGLEPVPSMKQLLPDRFPRVGFVLHAATLALGVVAVASGAAALARATGAGLVLTGLAMLAVVVKPLLKAPSTPPPAAGASAPGQTPPGPGR